MSEYWRDSAPKKLTDADRARISERAKARAESGKLKQAKLYEKAQQEAKRAEAEENQIKLF